MLTAHLSSPTLSWFIQPGMSLLKNACCLAVLLLPICVRAQGNLAPADSGTRHLTLDIAVSGGAAGTALTAQDFKLLDNKAPEPILSVRQVTPATVSVSAIIVVDAVNLPFTRVAYVRSEVDKFLKANGGHLAQPTTIAILTDKGAQVSKNFSTDGNALSASLSQADIGLREVRSNSGIWGADERIQISLTGLHQVLAFCAGVPGRKLVFWVSPGWPLLSGPHIDLDAKQQDQIFADVVSLYRETQQARTVVYDINPLGPEEALIRADYYQSFLKGVRKQGDAELADLSLQVIAAQSGGRVFTGSSDVSGSLTKSEDDARSWYEIPFEAAVPEHPNEYHHVQIEVNKPGVTARTRDGYYAQP